MAPRANQFWAYAIETKADHKTELVSSAAACANIEESVARCKR
jgi:hypothetical protein